jgi:hypothetical protein
MSVNDPLRTLAFPCLRQRRRGADVDPDTAKWIADNVSAYGEALAPLNEEVNFQSLHGKESVESTKTPAVQPVYRSMEVVRWSSKRA